MNLYRRETVMSAMTKRCGQQWICEREDVSSQGDEEDLLPAVAQGKRPDSTNSELTAVVSKL